MDEELVEKDNCRWECGRWPVAFPSNHSQTQNIPMDHLIEQCSDIAGVKPGHRKFQIVIVYENLVSAARALRACEFLRREIGDTVSVEVNVWKMGILEDGDSRRAAANASSLADVVIVSASGREEIPAAFRQWVEAWLQLDQCGRAALFALFGEHIGDGALSVAGYLRRKTILNGIDFFCHPPIDQKEFHRAADLQRALGPVSSDNPNEWRPGQQRDAEGISTRSPFDLIEDFAANLRARLAVAARTESEPEAEITTSCQTHLQKFAHT